MLGNTRKYHGLLVVADENLKRKVVLSSLEEKITFDGDKEVYLNTSLYNGNVINPYGTKCIINKDLSDKLTLEYQIEEIKVIKQIQMLQYSDQILVSYKIKTPVFSNFKLTPLITNRSFHNLARYNNAEQFKIENATNTDIVVGLSEKASLIINSSKFRFFPKNIVYNNFYYPLEEQRGYESSEDLIYSGTLVFDVFPNNETVINVLFSYVTDKKQTITQFSNIKNYVPELGLVNRSEKPKLEKLRDYITQGAKDFVVQSPTRTSVIAGYHWFEDWGRDTFISFRGLLLIPKQYDKARKMLIDWSKYIKHGIVPNRPGLEEYNSLDATLWYIISVYNYYITTQDSEILIHILPKIKDILTEFKKGTLFGIHIDERGYLVSTDETRALTWMDAVYDGIPFTARINAPVEIEMMWFNVLNMFKEMINISKMDIYDSEITEGYINEQLDKIKLNFETCFWNANTNTLNDFVKLSSANFQIRPNPVLGLHLPFEIIPHDKAILTLNTIGTKLITPIGLKTLDPQDNEYCPEYAGNQYERDKAYHNGTVWPWIYGFYLKSYLKINGNSEESKMYVRSRLEEMWDFIEKNKLNYLPEIFSAESLKPDGCISQAWNYAAFMEVLNEI
jgi:predicted glycogen debranching enzyme